MGTRTLEHDIGGVLSDVCHEFGRCAVEVVHEQLGLSGLYGDVRNRLLMVHLSVKSSTVVAPCLIVGK